MADNLAVKELGRFPAAYQRRREDDSGLPGKEAFFRGHPRAYPVPARPAAGLPGREDNSPFSGGVHGTAGKNRGRGQVRPL